MLKQVLRVMCCLLMLAGMVLLQPAAYAEGEFQEIIAEGVYPLGASDTLAKAEAQAMLLAEQNALAQAGVNNISLDDINNLPETVFSVSVLDKKKTVSDNQLAYWMQIKVLVKPDQLESALKSINPIWGGPMEYYDETIAYQNGKETARYRNWHKLGWQRNEQVSGMYSNGIITLEKSEKNNGVITQRFYYLKNNKYYETEPQRSTRKKELIGMEELNGVTVKKMRVISVDLGTKTTSDYIQWVDPVNQSVLKTQIDANGTSFVSVFQNLQIGPQDEALFKIPAGYTKCGSFEALDSGTTNYNAAANQPDPLQKATDAALEAATQRVLDNAIGGLFNF